MDEFTLGIILAIIAFIFVHFYFFKPLEEKEESFGIQAKNTESKDLTPSSGNDSKSISQKWVAQVETTGLKTVRPDTSQTALTIKQPAVNSTLNLKMTVKDGDYRTFENYSYKGQQYTFGFPKSNCEDKRIWVGIDQEEIDRVTPDELRARIGGSLRELSSEARRIVENLPNDAPISQRYRNCKDCGERIEYEPYITRCKKCYSEYKGNIRRKKKSQPSISSISDYKNARNCVDCGDSIPFEKYKTRCKRCYSEYKGNSGYSSYGRKGYCNNSSCRKKLRGNVSKPYCNACYKKGYGR